MAENRDVVDAFQEIKRQAKCDDVTAAILILAESVSRITVYLEEPENYTFNRVGKDVADAIESVTKEGAIQIAMNGEMLNISAKGGSAPITQKPKKKK